jgi:hypothetical protein
VRLANDRVALPTSRARDHRLGSKTLRLALGGKPATMLCDVDHGAAPRQLP